MNKATQAAVQEQAAVQAAVQDEGSRLPALAGIAVGVLLVGGLTAYLVARRKNPTGNTDSLG